MDFHLRQLKYTQIGNASALCCRTVQHHRRTGKKGKSSILKSQSSRTDFFHGKNHRICFVYTPKHCSWMNHIEIWFGIINSRLLKQKSYQNELIRVYHWRHSFTRLLMQRCTTYRLRRFYFSKPNILHRLRNFVFK